MTVKLPGRSAIEYCSFENWEDADRVAAHDPEGQRQRLLLRPAGVLLHAAQEMVPDLPDGRAQGEEDVGRLLHDDRHRRPRFVDAAPGRSSTAATRIRARSGGLDYWIICDDQRAYLFFTSLNGKMWRLWTKLEDFPQGFDHCELALEAKIFEASHTYRLKGLDKYLTIIEENGRRYYKAYLADRLDGPWTPVADTAEQPFAGWKNIRPAAGRGALDRQHQPRRTDPRRLRPDADRRSRQPAVRLPGHVGQGQVREGLRPVPMADRHADAGGKHRDENIETRSPESGQKQRTEK